MRFHVWLLSFFVSLLFPIFSFATSEIPTSYFISKPTSIAKVALVPDYSILSDQTEFKVGIHFTLPEGWHVYGKEPGEFGYAPILEWVLPQGLSSEEIIWPKETSFTFGNYLSYGYKNDFMLVVPFSISSESVLKRSVSLAGSLEWLICSDRCVPEEASFEVFLPTASESMPNELFSSYLTNFFPENEALIASQRDSAIETTPIIPVEVAPLSEFDPAFLLMLLFAFFGGVILNLMPCVFPVLSLKIVQFVEDAAESDTPVWYQSSLFTLGVLSGFWGLGILLFGLRHYGVFLGWGFQLQSVWFVVVMCALFYVMGLQFLGVFEWGAFMGRLGDLLTSKTGGKKSFFTGLLTTLVATPCTAPFMGTAVGVALTQSGLQGLLIFTCLGLGVSAPYLVLSFFPGWVSSLPSPGMWMVRFKQVLAFPLFASAIWLSWVLGSLSGLSGVIFLWSVLLGLSFLIWVVDTFGRDFFIARVLCGIIVVLLLGSTIHFFNHIQPSSSAQPLSQITGIEWLDFPENGLGSLSEISSPIFINFTADWCVTCKINESFVFTNSGVKSLFEQLGVVAVKADWTRRTPIITQTLALFDRGSVPTYVFFPSGIDSEYVLLPELLTPGALEDILRPHLTKEPKR